MFEILFKVLFNKNLWMLFLLTMICHHIIEIITKMSFKQVYILLFLILLFIIIFIL